MVNNLEIIIRHNSQFLWLDIHEYLNSEAIPKDRENKRSIFFASIIYCINKPVKKEYMEIIIVLFMLLVEVFC